MREINAYGSFVSDALMAIHEHSEFMLLLPRWKRGIIRPLIEEQLREHNLPDQNPMKSLHGVLGVLKAFWYSPIGTIVKMALESNYVVTLSEKQLIFRKGPER